MIDYLKSAETFLDNDQPASVHDLAECQVHALINIAQSLRTIATRPDSDEVERLTRWKSEALPVLDGLQELGSALGLPLGERITGPAALEAVQRLTARAENAEATIERARELADSWARSRSDLGPVTRACGALLRAVLDGGGPDA